MADQVVAYTLGPFSFGASSPIGGLLGFANGISRNYATGLTTYTANPALGGAILSGAYAGGPGPVAQAAATPMSDNPFVATGQTIGSILGAGVTGIGTIAGVGGAQAAPGVAMGVSGVTGGAANVASAGLLGGVKGALSGGLSGISTGLGAPNLGQGVTVGGQTFGAGFLMVGAGLALLLIFLLLI